MLNTILTTIIIMVNIGKGKIIKLSSARTRFVSIPAEVASDDRFPFDLNEDIQIRIDGERLVVEKIEDN